jgi:hypothetical protein
MTTKSLGELGEILFTAQAALRGFSVAVPCGETQQYDRIVDNGNRCLRVQIKTTSGTTFPGTYTVDCTHRASKSRSLGKKKVAYNEDEIDFLVIYVLPENTWYIPVKALRGRQCLTIRVAESPNPGNSAPYKEAWSLLWEGGNMEKARTGLIDSLLASAEVPEWRLDDVASEFICEATGPGRIEFRVWTASEPPTPEAVARILGTLLGESPGVPVRAGEMGFA